MRRRCTKSTKIKKKFKWTDECNEAFEKLRTYLTSSDHVITLPDFEKPFVIETDASNYGIGAVLSQLKGSIMRPVGYFSKTFSKAEYNYPTSEKELLALVRAVEYFKEYIYGRKFTVVTDHLPLKWALNAAKPASRLARWIITLSNYNFELEYRKGKQNNNADAI